MEIRAPLEDKKKKARYREKLINKIKIFTARRESQPLDPSHNAGRAAERRELERRKTI